VLHRDEDRRHDARDVYDEAAHPPRVTDKNRKCIAAVAATLHNLGTLYRDAAGRSTRRLKAAAPPVLARSRECTAQRPSR
jgi:hypothetical protein